MTTDPSGVLDPNTADYVLPAPPRGAGEVVVVAPRREAGRAWRRGSDVARSLGDRFLVMAESHQIFARELRERLNELDQSIADGSRAQWKGATRDLLAVLDWADAVQADMVHEARLAAGGAEPIEVADLCAEVAAQVQTPDQPVFVTGHATSPWWGSAPALADLVEQALALVGERTQGVGARSIEVRSEEGSVHLAIAGMAEPGDGVDCDSIARFRGAVARVGAVVRPDALGPGGTGLVVELPGSAPGGA